MWDILARRRLLRPTKVHLVETVVFLHETHVDLRIHSTFHLFKILLISVGQSSCLQTQKIPRPWLKFPGLRHFLILENILTSKWRLLLTRSCNLPLIKYVTIVWDFGIISTKGPNTLDRSLVNQFQVVSASYGQYLIKTTVVSVANANRKTKISLWMSRFSWCTAVNI